MLPLNGAATITIYCAVDHVERALAQRLSASTGTSELVDRLLLVGYTTHIKPLAVRFPNRPWVEYLQEAEPKGFMHFWGKQCTGIGSLSWWMAGTS